MTTQVQTSRGFTGWHMFGILCAFFGVIIIVNLIMAYFAVSTWSGLVVKNSYVASQEFNEKSITGKEQQALLWQGEMGYSNGSFTYTLTDKDGVAIETTSAVANFKRPVGDVQDTTVTLTMTENGKFTGDVALGEGAWIAEVNTEAGLEDPYRHISRFIIVNGEYK